MLGQPGDAGLLVPQLLPIVPQLDREMRLVELLVLDEKRQAGAVLTMANQELVVGRAKRTQRGHEPCGFEQIGFPMAVPANEKMLSSGKLERGKAHVAKMPERKFAQAHSGKSSRSEDHTSELQSRPHLV